MSDDPLKIARTRLHDAYKLGGHSSVPSWWGKTMTRLGELYRQWSSIHEDSMVPDGMSLKDTYIHINYMERVHMLPGDLLNINMLLAQKDVLIEELRRENELLKEALEDATFDPAIKKE